MRSRTWITIAVAMMMGFLAAAQAGAGPIRYAGTVRTVDLTRGSLVVEDVGPSAGETDTPITPRTIVLSPSTEYFVAARAERGDSGYRNDYATVRANRSEIKAGAFVSVECQQEGDRCTASKLVVVRISEP
jgi:hypothetical protein